MVSRREYYERVNLLWHDAVCDRPGEMLPPLTFPEARRAARKLARFAQCRPLVAHIVETTGNRYTTAGARYGELRINVSRGWKEFIHLLSHVFDRSGHTKEHARFEKALVAQVLKRGWLDGRLKDKPKVVVTPPSPGEKSSEKIEHAKAMLAKAETRLKRAVTIERKWRRSLNALVRHAKIKAQAQEEV